jgi:hypothetical protein
MIRSIRALYLGRPLREKIMLVAFFAIVAVWWLSNFAGRVESRWEEARATTLDLQDQAQWIARRDSIFDARARAVGKLDAARSLDGTRLLATVGTLAREAGLRNTNSGEISKTSSGQFAIYRLSFNVTGADWASLKAFYLSLGRYSPYIGIEQFTVQSNRANPAELNVVARLSSVEIAAAQPN